jgi:Dihydrofolate reductase
MQLISVAAVADNAVIGNDGELPWPSIPADKQQYRATVAAAPVILGRRTFESMRDALPGAHQVILSRSDPTYPEPTAVTVDGVEAAIDACAATGADVAYVLGGAQIYALMQPHIDGMRLSRVHGSYDGDSRYPPFDPASWELVETIDYDRFTIERWARE